MTFLFRGPQCNYFIVSRLELAIDVEDFCVLMIERAVAACQQLCLNLIFNGMALRALLDEFGSIFPAAQSCFSSTFANPLVPTLRYFSGAVQDFADSPGGIMRRHRFYTAVQMEMALLATKDFVAELAAR